MNINLLSSSLDLRAHTGSTLALEDMSKILSSAPTETSTENSVNNNESLMNVLGALSMLLSDVQAETAKVQAISGQNHAEIAGLFLNNAQNQLTTIKNEINQQIAAQEAQAHASWWQKLANWIMAAVGVVIAVVGAIVPGLQWLAPIGITLAVTSIASATGATQWIISQISQFLQTCGVSADTANVIADVLVAVVVAACSAGGGAVATDFSTFMNGLKSALSNLTTLTGAVGAAFMAAPNLIQDCAICSFDHSNMTAEEKKEKLAHLAFIQAICSMVFAIVGALPSLIKAGSQIASLFKSSTAATTATTAATAATTATTAATTATTAATTAASSATRTWSDFFNQLNKPGRSWEEFFKVMTSDQIGEFTQAASSDVANITVQTFNYKTDLMLADSYRQLAKAEAANTINFAGLSINTASDKMDNKSFGDRLKNTASMMADITNAIGIEGNSYAQAIAG
jgi:hypothetical protein